MLRTLVAVLLSAAAVAFPATARAGAFTAPLAAPALAPALPPGFSESVVWDKLGNPTALAFADDGGVFVATKAGVIYRFDGLDDRTPTEFADLSAEVHDFWDRGLLGLAVDPDGGDVYVAYSHDTGWGDTCPNGGTDGSCVIDARLSRLDENGDEHVLIDGEFCQQFPSHSIGTLAFGPDGMLYLSAGEGAAFYWTDFGQVKGNPCHDPPNPTGPIGLPDSQGGALRAQSFRRPEGQATTLNGAILRLDPATGEAAPGNPATGDANRRRIVAYGFRNPFRFTFRPGTHEIWAGDVGQDAWEEIDRIPDVTRVRNYGWPCYEGDGRQSGFDALDVDSCETLYGEGGATEPYFAYSHADEVVDGDGCGNSQSSVSALTFYEGPAFPAAYDGALFFGDYARGCIWVMPLVNGQPST
ncbi:MAG TPA: PQQ-dependent sugar dehydrogenase, partial [Solirubrobacter sp.]|nr:PQQ-dependent sugar dehydrogenase [Solirubrobacter sp.]